MTIDHESNSEKAPDFSTQSTLCSQKASSASKTRSATASWPRRIVRLLRDARNRERRSTDLEIQAIDTENEDGNISDGLSHTEIRQLEKCPRGYPRLAAFNASEQNFMLYRGFSCIHARLLLNLQYDIQELERELDELDETHASIPSEQIRLECRGKDIRKCAQEQKLGERTRADILDDLLLKVTQYDELMIKSRELVSFQKPTERDYRSVRNYFHKEAPLIDEEQSYVLWQEDLVTLRHGREWASFDGAIEELLHKLNCRLIRWMFCTPDQRRKTTDEKIYYFSPSRVSKLVNLLITVVIFLLLAAPVMGMYKLSCLRTSKAMFAAIGVLMVFTLLFACALSLLTKARRHELFAASAAYCAVLVVFIGSSNFT